VTCPSSSAAAPSAVTPSYWDDNSADPATNNADEMVATALNNVNFLNSLCEAATRVALCFPIHNQRVIDMGRTIARAFPLPPFLIDANDEVVDSCAPEDPPMALSDDERPAPFRREALLRAGLYDVDVCLLSF